MKSRKILLCLFILFLSINVYAANEKCEKDELSRLKKLASKVEFKYDYELNSDNKAVFTITATNLDSDLRVLIIEDYYSEKYKEFKNNDIHTNSLSGFSSGEKVEVTIRGYVPNRCSGEKLRVKTIRLPYYNYFYDEEFCRENSDFKYCKILLDNDISQNEYDMQMNRYLRVKEAKNEELKPRDVTDNSWIKILIIVISSIAVVTTIVIVLIKVRRKNSL